MDPCVGHLTKNYQDSVALKLHERRILAAKQIMDFLHAHHRRCIFLLVSQDALREGYLLQLLRTFPPQRWSAMWRNLTHAKRHFLFQVQWQCLQLRYVA